MARRKKGSGVAPSQEGPQNEWAGEFHRALAAAHEATEATRAVSDWLWTHVVASHVHPRDMPADLKPSLDSLNVALKALTEALRDAFNRFSSDPTAKFVQGRPLTQEEYYLIRAMGVDFGTVLAGIDPYDQFRMLQVKTTNGSCYINVDARPRDPSSQETEGRFGRPPEEVDLRDLTPEQRRFFREKRADVYARFAAANTKAPSRS